jgi:hypothetical protein
VHGGPAQLLVVGLLPSRHLHEGRAAQEDLGLLVDEHGVVAHAGHVGAARGRVAEHERQRRDAHARELGEVVEDLPGRHEQVGLRGPVGATWLHEVDHREPVDQADLEGSEVLLQRVRVHGAAPHRRVVGDHHAFDARHDADAGDDAGSDVEPAPPRRQRRQFQEGRPDVEQEVDPLPGQQAATCVVAGRVPVASARSRHRQLPLVPIQQVEQTDPVGLVGLAGEVDGRRKHGHRRRYRASGSGTRSIAPPPRTLSGLTRSRSCIGAFFAPPRAWLGASQERRRDLRDWRPPTGERRR